MTTLETLKEFRDKIDCIIYHNPCQDGQTAAWIAYSYLWEKRDTLILIPRDNNKTPTDDRYTDKVVLCLDVLPCDYELIVSKARHVIVLDHHATNAALLVDNTWAQTWTHFDMTKSGTGLVWEYFYDSLEIFPFLDYIQQRDLWKFKPGDEKIVSVFCRGLMFLADSFDNIHDYFKILFNLSAQTAAEQSRITLLTHKNTLYSHLASYNASYNPLVLSSVRNPHSMSAIIELGNLLTRSINAKIQQYISTATPHTVTVAYNDCDQVETYTRVYIINTTDGITSELGNAFMEQTDADFVIMWYYSSAQKIYYYSLRSNDQKVDVGRLAKQYGGGGHRNAAGISGPFINELFAQTIL